MKRFKHMFYKTLIVILSIVFVSSTVFASSSDYGNNSKYSNGEILIKYKKSSIDDNVKQHIKDKLSLSQFKTKKKSNSGNIEVLQIGTKDDLNKTIAELKSNPDVEYAQPNYKLSIETDQFNIDTYLSNTEASEKCVSPLNTELSKQWGLYNKGQDINGQAGIPGEDISAIPAWKLTVGSEDVVVGVLDTGVDINHVDLTDNIYINKGEVAGNGIDDDGNGYIDDITGWDFANGDNTLFDSASYDAHGTHLSGIIAARGNINSIIGVASRVRILHLKFIEKNEGDTFDAILAIEYASQMGVKIINCSWSGPDYNYALEDAMKNTDILFTCSAGNKSSDLAVNPLYPACFEIPNIMTVAATDNRGKLAVFSNYGSKVDVAAPGMNIYSSMPNNQYFFGSGTSMAAPHVAGIAALLKSYKPKLQYFQIAACIKNTVDTSEELTGKVSSNGRVNAYSALKYSKKLKKE